MTPTHDRTQTLSLVQTECQRGAARAYLLVVGKTSSFVHNLPTAGEFIVGRADDAAIRIDEHAASRQHARFRVCASRVTVCDLGSRNGTWVNGAPVRGECVLAAGDMVQVGGAAMILQHGPLGTVASGVSGGAAEPAPALRRLQLGERQVLLADPAMLQLYDLLRRLAASSLPVLVTGETGTGKENAAFAVHHFSRRSDGPFISINCAAIPESLVESELFGHERGAFSGAVAAKPGRLEAASGGTLFLDELGELSGAVQAKLLRVLETGRMLPVGATREREVDLRIVAATNRDLEAEIRAGRFRQDLFFRLCAATVVLPPLRERQREIALLAADFLSHACARAQRPPLRLTDATLQLLLGHGWPGNVRELRNLMDYAAVAVLDDELRPEHLPARVRSPERPSAQLLPDTASAPPVAAPPPRSAVEASPLPNIADEVAALEKKRIAQALDRSDGNQRRAAALIGMPLRTFVSKIEQYGLRPGARSDSIQGQDAGRGSRSAKRQQS